VAEALVLNRPLPERVCASAVRFPRVLTDTEVRDVIAERGQRRAFDILETEAVAAAVYGAFAGAHGLFTPVWRGVVTPELLLAASVSPADGDDEPSEEPHPASQRSGPVFPAEQLQEISFVGMKRIVGPLYPAHEALKHVLSDADVDASQAAREEWTRVVGSHLYHIVPSGLKFSVDAS
jgi:hypothetical protein